MRHFLLLVTFLPKLLWAASVIEAYQGSDFSVINKPVNCFAPSQSYFENKLKTALHLSEAETELREVVRHPGNFSNREEIKSLGRQMRYSTRQARQGLEPRLASFYESMIATARRSPIINDFPVKSSVSQLSVSDNGLLMLSMESLPKAELNFLPVLMQEKFGDKVKIHYDYPLDKFHYVLSYDGKDFPMQEALHRMQDDFESLCTQRALDNREERMWRERRHNKGGNSGTSSSM